MCGYVGNFIAFVHAYAGRWGHRVHIEWQRPVSALSGVHSIMMEKVAQAGEVSWWAPLTLFTITYKVSDTLPLCTPWLGGVNDTANDVFTCAIIGDQYSVNYVTDNNDIFFASVDYTARKKWEQFVACISDMGENDSLKKKVLQKFRDTVPLLTVNTP
jgi:hypothetical protein